MSVTAQAGMFGFGPQTGKGVLATTWYRHRAVNVDLGTIDEVREGAPEVGGMAVPTFPYKAGPIIAGGATLQPRLENTLGWLLYALLGTCSSGADYGDVYDHEFTLNADSTFVPWVSFRKHIPRKDNGVDTDLGEIFQDCKVMGGTLVLPNDAPVTLRLDALGRIPALAADPTAWTWENTFESWESIPVGVRTEGYIKIDGEELPIIAATVGFANVPLDLRMEKIYGDPYLEDVTVVQRRLAFDLTIKWNNPQLYRKVLTGAVSGVDVWCSKPQLSTVAIKCASADEMPAETGPYTLRVEATDVMMSMNGGITLAGSQSVLMRFTGLALDDGATYCSFILHNKQAAYTWPS